MTTVTEAYLIGIEYTDYEKQGVMDKLPGCFNDVYAMRTLLASWQTSTHKINFHLYTDDGKNPKPTRSNILVALNSVPKNKRSIFYYSGHGSQTAASAKWKPYESDGKAETIVPCDFLTNGMITDDNINGALMKLTSDQFVLLITDSCHSGTICNLPNILRWQGRDLLTIGTPPKDEKIFARGPNKLKLHRAQLMKQRTLSQQRSFLHAPIAPPIFAKPAAATVVTEEKEAPSVPSYYTTTTPDGRTFTVRSSVPPPMVEEQPVVETVNMGPPRTLPQLEKIQSNTHWERQAQAERLLVKPPKPSTKPKPPSFSPTLTPILAPTKPPIAMVTTTTSIVVTPPPPVPPKPSVPAVVVVATAPAGFSFEKVAEATIIAGNVISIAACTDNDTALSITSPTQQDRGLMTLALETVMKAQKSSQIPLYQLLQQMRTYISSRGYTQLTQISTAQINNPGYVLQWI